MKKKNKHSKTAIEFYFIGSEWKCVHKEKDKLIAASQFHHKNPNTQFNLVHLQTNRTVFVALSL